MVNLHAHHFRQYPLFLSGFLVLLTVSACSLQGGGSSAVPTAVSQPTQLAAPTVSTERPPCEDGRLLLADLTKVDAELPAGLAEAAEIAANWQPDARLVEFRVTCALFEPGFRWQGIYFSDTSQVLFSTDTLETTPTNLNPENVQTLSLESVSFGLLHRALIKAGFTDDLEIGAASGVDLRINSEEIPFGPAEAPKDVSLFYVSILRRGEVKDVFVSSADGALYRVTVGS